MRTLTALLLLAGLAMAIPFRKGGSWQWRIVDPNTGTQTYRLAKVVDSTGSDSGSIWTLLIADSTSQKTWDTASILVRPDNSQRWWKPSARLPWDPEPWNGQMEQFTTIGWGMAWAAANGLGSFSIVPATVGWPTLSTTVGWPWPLMSVGQPEGNSVIDLPMEEFDSALGWARARFETRTSIATVDWILSTKDGKILSPARRDTLRKMLLPSIGSNWLWEVHTSHASSSGWSTAGGVVGIAPTVATDTFRRLSWTFSGFPPDSAGWMRASVLATMDSGTTQGGSTMLLLRWNPLTGQRAASSARFDPDLSDGFWSDWADSAGPNLFRRGSFSYNSVLTSEATIESYRQIRLSGGLDSAFSGDLFKGYNENFTNSTVTIRLLQKDGTLVRTGTDGIRVDRRTTGLLTLSSLSNLRQELSTHPTSIVRVTDLSGRTHAFPASEAMTYLGNRHGIVQVDVLDGAFKTSGRLFLP